MANKQSRTSPDDGLSEVSARPTHRGGPGPVRLAAAGKYDAEGPIGPVGPGPSGIL